MKFERDRGYMNMSGCAWVSLSLCVCARARARARVCVCVCVCVMTLNYKDAMYNSILGFASMYEIERQLELPAGMNTVLC